MSMYTFSNNIQIRTCNDLSFFININNNSIFTLKTSTLNFLKSKLKEGLNAKKLNYCDSNFIKFIKSLEEQHILEVIENENERNKRMVYQK